MTYFEWERLSWTFVSIALGMVVRSLVFAALAAGAVWLLRLKTAELRWTLWRWTLLALVALPVLMQVTPPVVRTSQTVSNLKLAVVPSIAPVSVTMQKPQLSLSVPRGAYLPFWVAAAPVLYLLVALVLSFRLVFNLVYLRKIANQSTLIRDLPFCELAHDIWLKSEAFYRPRVAVSSHVTSPVTFNAETSWILLPPSWSDWSEEKLRAVLIHEMAHVRRDDSAHLQFASFVICLFWFHPLAWFLRRQLAALAEEACDEAVVAQQTTPETYANFLIDFASDVTRGHGRLVAEATAFVRGPALQRRIERIFANHQSLQRGRKLFAGLTLLLFLPTLYLTAAAHFDEPSQEPASVSFDYQQIFSMTPADAGELEAKLQRNPDDIETRTTLAIYYARTGKDDQLYLQHLFWLIGHYPENRNLERASMLFGRIAKQDPLLGVQVESAWREALTQRPPSPATLSNAASFIQDLDPERAIPLLRQARDLASSSQRPKYMIGLSMIYAMAEIQTVRSGFSLNSIQMNAAAAARLRADLEGSGDAAMLAETGTRLAELSYDSPKQYERGLTLLALAIQLDPGNPEWKEKLESIKAQPRFNSMASQQAGPSRISSKDAEAALVGKIDPVYPPLAKQARIQGIVEFKATIDKEGKVDNLELVRGHPLLVNAAKDAVLQWVYHPATVDGQPVPFQTEVTVQFTLAQ